MVPPAGCGRLPVAWLWSRRLTEPPRPADTRDAGDAEGLKKYAENIVGGGWCGCQAFALFFRRFASCAVDCTDAGIIRIKILRGRRLLCKKPLPRTPFRRTAGVRGDFSAYLVPPPRWVRSVTCCLVVVTAADRAAVTCRHEGCWGCRRFEKICRKYCRRRRSGCQAFDLFFRRFVSCAVDCADAGIIRIKILRGRRLLCKKPLPRTPSRRTAGVRGDFSAYLVPPAGCGRLPVAWLWSRRLTEPPRPADTRDAGDAEGLKKYAENIVGGGWCGCQAFALFFRRFAPCAVDCTDAGIMLQ